MIEALGGTPVEYDGARKCCGFPVITMNRDTSLRQAGTHIADALDAGADCLVTPCPLCHLNLDMQQPEAAKVTGRDLGLAVLHLPQLVGAGPGLRAEGARDGQAHRLDRVGRGAPRRRGPRLTDGSRAAPTPEVPKPPPEVEPAVMLGHIEEAVSLYVYSTRTSTRTRPAPLVARLAEESSPGFAPASLRRDRSLLSSPAHLALDPARADGVGQAVGDDRARGS